MPKYRILKLRADKILYFCLTNPEKRNTYNISYQLNLDNPAIYGQVVEEQLVMENCALFDQFQIVLKKKNTKESIRDWLLQELTIVDFTNIYKKKHDISETAIEQLITNGFIMHYMDKEIHMLPFDKSGNMSRKCRLSFINAEYLEVMNERLNLGIDFGKIHLQLSKYYAYRGLYLSTAKRISNALLKLTPDDLIVIDDDLIDERQNDDKQVKKNFTNKIVVEEGIIDERDPSKITFEKTLREKEKNTVPYDGQGIVSPLYADMVNEVLGGKNIHSFQIRLPFVKGMLHMVDFHAFFHEFDPNYTKDTYIIKDAFGIERDLKRANIILTKSMFKCFNWLKTFYKSEQDPMQFYCEALKKYEHTLYVSSTDQPYGDSKVTHISYQLLNTLKLTEEQFQSLINKQLDYIRNPINYIQMTQGQRLENDDEEGEVTYNLSNWQRAVLRNPSFGHLLYIKNQLKNTQVALMTKLVTGKLVVTGQVRFMTRDLPFMLVNLIQNKEIRKELEHLKIFDYRFFLPQGTEGRNEMGLEYFTYCGFFRSPHLSRNEQGLLAPVISKQSPGERYVKDYTVFNKYFGHLTGIVMFGNESLEPMALGGADFDGDLVSMITDEDIVDAIKAGVYTENTENPLDIYRREDVPYIKIPTMQAEGEVVPKLIPYSHIKNTFSNEIGLISNAAIAIGQYEYGNKKGLNSEVKCSHCTILTGLEIDAAKNGVHPDLTYLTDNLELKRCNYLDFKQEFGRLKKRKDYHFNQLYMEKDEKDGTKYKLGLKGTNKTIEYIEEAGTYINKLPIVFMENLNPKLNLPAEKGAEYFSFPEYTTVQEEQEQDFINQCDLIINTYRYYIKLFNFIKKETKKENYSESNLKKLLNKQYDSETVKKIIAEELPYIYKQIANKMSDYKKYTAWKQNIKQANWHLMDLDEKKKFLCKILCVRSIKEKKWSIVLQPYNHGYKILWHIIQIIGAELNKDYGSLRNKFDEIQSMRQTNTEKKDFEQLEQMYNMEISLQADELFVHYLKNKEPGAQERLYNICLEHLREAICACDLLMSRKIELLFRLTKNADQKARFFWDGFEWEELEPYIVKAKEDVYAG